MRFDKPHVLSLGAFSQYIICHEKLVDTEFRSTSTVLLRPIVQSYVMKGRELNKFGSCHMSFSPLNDDNMLQNIPKIG